MKPAAWNLRSRRGAVLIETALFLTLLPVIVVFSIESVHLLRVYSAVVNVARDAAITVKNNFPAPNLNIINREQPDGRDTLRNNGVYDGSAPRTMMHAVKNRIYRAGKLVFPGIEYRRLDAFTIPDRFNNDVPADDHVRYGEIAFSLWTDPNPAATNNAPYRYMASSVSCNTPTPLACYETLYSMPDAFEPVHSTAFSRSTAYAPFTMQVNTGISASLAEMWYEYRPMTGMFRAMLKKMTGKDYRVLHAVATA